MKKFGLFLFALSLVAAPALGVTQEIIVGETYQCWNFDQETSMFGILPDVDENPFGTPAAMINDLSGTGVFYTPNYGGWYGEEFKIFLDIPNQDIPNPYKILTITMRFQGELSFAWAADVVTGDLFTAMTDPIIEDGDVWRTYTQTFRFEPNPRQEIVVIGIKGAAAPAAMDQLCISTICIPEPMTLALLATGGLFVMRKKRNG